MDAAVAERIRTLHEKKDKYLASVDKWIEKPRRMRKYVEDFNNHVREHGDDRLILPLPTNLKEACDMIDAVTPKVTTKSSDGARPATGGGATTSHRSVSSPSVNTPASDSLIYEFSQM